MSINGRPATLGQTVDPHNDRVTVDGRVVKWEDTPLVWLVLNKPAGVMTTRADPSGRPTVFDLVDDVPGLTYVGRLDFDTEGVLLLTTDGEAVHRLTHPSSQVERTYIATVTGDARAAAQRARSGVVLRDGPVRPLRIDARPLANGRWEFEVVIAEGRKREVRRLCTALGLRVHRLVRTAFGPVRLGRLARGATRNLTRGEQQALVSLVGREDR